MSHAHCSPPAATAHRTQVEMHTGEPLFSGVDSHDQMYKMVQILGMPPNDLIAKAEQRSRCV